MIPLPEWAPNIHPLVVHFPIALLFVAVLIDSVGLMLKVQLAFRVATLLFTLGALAALAAFFTGEAASATATISTVAQSTLSQHETWAGRTAWFYGLYAVARLVLFWFDSKQSDGRRWVYAIAFLVGASGLLLVVQTADRGAKMVFLYGVGVRATSTDVAAPPEYVSNPSSETSADSAASVTGNTGRGLTRAEGYWHWSAETGLSVDFEFLEGSAPDLNPVASDSVLTLELDGHPVLFVVNSSFDRLQQDVLLNVEEFDGYVRMVANVQDRDNYDFLGLEDGKMILGRVSDDVVSVFDSKAQSKSGWLSVRAVHDGRHSRGYVGGQLRVHGHDSPAEPGTVGLRLEGKGIVLLKSISAQRIE